MRHCHGIALAVLSVIALLGAASGTVTAATRNVPSPSYPTIQAGLNAAQGGDTVQVAGGTYSESMFWPFRNGIVLVGAGKDITIVNGNRLDPGLYMAFTGIDSTTVVRDIGIRNGGDAGITLYTAAPIIESCAVDSSRSGPGIYCLGGAQARIRSCRISNNMGSGIRCESSSPKVSENAIFGNSASPNGGGIYCYDSSPTLTGNTISGNSANSGSGGGIYCCLLSPTLAGNTISGNSAYNGGGIFSDCCSPTLTGNTISGNSASDQGGGFYCYSGYNNSSPTLTGNTIFGNSANKGGGIYFWWAFPTLTGNTIADNFAAFGGGGLYCGGYSSPVLTENTICRNTTQGDGGAFGLFGATPQLLRNTLTENSAGNRGDGIYAESSSPGISACNIAYNGWGYHNRTATPIPNIQDNWWGDPTGPWHTGMNPGGLGDSLSTYSWDFIPWLAEADTTAPPIPPRHLRVVEARSGSLTLTWDAVPLGDLAGYRVYFDADSSAFPYSRSADAGTATEISLPGLSPDSTYYIAVTCYDQGGERSWFSREITAVPAPDGSTVDGEPGRPSAVRLEPTFPNPFRAETTVRYALPADQRVRVSVYSTEGRHLATLADGVESAGSHARRWQATDDQGRPLSAGIYLIRIETQGAAQTRKVVLID